MNRRLFLLGTGGIAAAGGAAAVWSANKSRTAYDVYTAALRRPLDPDGGLSELVRMASLAPNGHNTQPWRFRHNGQMLTITPDFTRRTPVVDPDDHHLFVSLGAAAENLAITGAAMGLPGDIVTGDDGAIRYAFQSAAAKADPLTEAIVKRQSTRAVYDSSSVEAAAVNALAAAGRADGVRLVLITERKKMDSLRDLVVAGNSAQMDDPAFVAELKDWLRFSPASAMDHGDGLYSAASGNPSLPDFLGRIAFDLVFKKASENEKYAKQIDSSAGLAVFFAERADKQGWVTVGRAHQRFLLEATQRGLACAYVNQPVEVAGLRPDLAALAGEKDLRPDLVIRFGRAAPLPYSPRRSVERVLA